jgi:hypothetical protein
VATWTLYDPNRQQVFYHVLDGSVDPGLFTLGQTGTYSILVHGSTDRTGAYRFQLQDGSGIVTPVPPTPVPATGAQIGFEVADSLNAVGERKSYTFTAEPGQMLYLDGMGDNNLIRAQLTDETGAQAAPEWWLDRDNGLVTLETGGAYTITVFSVQDATGAYAFKLWDVPPPQTFETAIEDTVSDGVPGVGAGNIETPGVQDVYTFTAEAGQVVYLDGLGTSNTLRARLTDSSGTEVAPEWWLDRDNGVVTLEQGGAYTLTAFGALEATGTYSFKLWDVPPPQTFEIAIGDTVSEGAPSAGAGNIESPGVQDIFTFTAQVGQKVYLDGLGTSNTLRARLTDSTGTQTAPEWWLDRDNGVVTLEAGGTYTITVFGAQEAIGTYSFKIWDVPEAQAFEIAIGDAVSENTPAPGMGVLESPGVEDVYTFTAEPGQVILFDGQGGGAYIRATLTDDSGTPIFESEWMDRSAAIRTLERGATYTLRVFGVDGATGPYAFQVWDVPAPQAFEIAIGDIVADGQPGEGAGNIETPGVQDVYTLTAEAGQVIMFDAQGGSAYIRATMTDEDGTLIFEEEWTDRAAAQRALERGGTYTITVHGVDDTVGTYSFQVWDVPPPQEFAIAIGDAVSDGAPGEGAGNIETPGVYDVYTFTAQPGQVIELQGQVQDGFMRYTLLDETGEEVFENVPVSGRTGPYTLTRGGTYTLRVFGDLDAVGMYEFAFVSS